jgi:ParB-like chromosome segregation protein Spo0J|tara:strand:- start:373 stop:966 length:594 start_codon:yes stop_codon:yes gene_type:complete
MKVVQVNFDLVIPYENNPRNNKEAVDKVAASIKEFGFRQPIVVDEEYVILVGHTRLAAAKLLGIESVPVHIAEGLTESQKKAYRIADNRVAQDSKWDDVLLKIELEDLDQESYDLENTGFTLPELDILMAEPEEEEDEDDGLLDDSYTIQYNIIFNDEQEQKQWMDFLRWLKSEYTGSVTISERLVAFTQGAMIDSK